MAIAIINKLRSLLNLHQLRVLDGKMAVIANVIVN